MPCSGGQSNVRCVQLCWLEMVSKLLHEGEKGERIIMGEQKLKSSEDLVSTVRSMREHFGLCRQIRGEEEINGMPEKKGQWINKLHK